LNSCIWNECALGCSSYINTAALAQLNHCSDAVKKSEAMLDRRYELKAKKCLLEETLLLKLEQLYELCLQEAVSLHSLFLVVAKLLSVLTSLWRTNCLLTNAKCKNDVVLHY